MAITTRNGANEAEVEAARNRAEIYYGRLTEESRKLEQISSRTSMHNVRMRMQNIIERYVLGRDAAEVQKTIRQLQEQLNNTENRQIRDDLGYAISVLQSNTTQDVLTQQIIAEQRLRRDKALRKLTEDILKDKRAVQRIVRSLNEKYTSGDNYKNIPEEYRKLVGLFLNTIALHDAGGKGIAFDKERAGKLLQQYQGLMAEDARYDGMIFDTTMQEYLQDLSEAAAGITELSTTRNADDMTRRLIYWEQVREVTEFVEGIVKHGNDIRIAGKRARLDELAVRFIEKHGGMKNKKFLSGGGKLGDTIRGIRHFVGWGNLTPEYFFRMIDDETLSGLQETIKQGENAYGLLMGQAFDRLKELAKVYNRSGWQQDKEISFTTQHGKDVTLTLQQAMSVYATWVREHYEGQIASKHLEHGGFVLARNISDGRLRFETTAPKTGTALTQADFEYIESQLGRDVIGYVNAVVKYMSEDMSEIGNAASMEMYGVRKYKEQYYFPIKSSRETMFQKSDAGAQSTTDDSRMKNQGFTKSRLNHANNTVLIEDFDLVTSGHIQQMITYASFVNGLESLNRFLNYSWTTDSGKHTIRAMFGEKYGD